MLDPVSVVLGGRKGRELLFGPKNHWKCGGGVFGCAMIFAEHASVKFAPAVLEPEGMILTSPMSTDYKEKDK